MAKPQDEATNFMENLFDHWRAYARSGSDLMRGQHRQMAEMYREFLDKQIDEDPMDAMERDWARKVTQLLMDSVKSQREARAQFVKAQRSLIDDYISCLDRSGEEGEDS
jgi:isopenicillin N synthase-like dioxygenase